MIYDLAVSLGYFGYRFTREAKKGGPTFAEKFGFQLLKRLPKGECYWFHAVSLGEMRALQPFAKRFEGRGVPLIFSTQTKTGFEEARRAFPGATHIYLPLDLRHIFRRIFKQVKPKAIFLTESDFWWNFLKEGKRAGAKIFLINGKLSERSKNLFSSFPWLAKPLFKLIDCFCLQNALYETRFLELGVPKEKCKITGNLKITLPDMKRGVTRQEIGLLESDRLLVIGSTHETEEEMLLKALLPLLKKWENLKIAFVPRHPERFETVYRFLMSTGQSVRRITEEKPELYRLLLVDKMGVLGALYKIADAAIVAGSFVTHVGGHHLLEPTLVNTPTLFGPHTKTQSEFRSLALAYGAGYEVTLETLPEVLGKILSDPEERERIRRAAGELAKKESGAVERSLREIEPFGIVLA